MNPQTARDLLKAQYGLLDDEIDTLCPTEADIVKKYKEIRVSREIGNTEEGADWEEDNYVPDEDSKQKIEDARETVKQQLKERKKALAMLNEPTTEEPDSPENVMKGSTMDRLRSLEAELDQLSEEEDEDEGE